ncbi:hypothetical protein [Streptosporangium sp. NBC_01756]|nr:hypothetical protein [Streptosporangium sp. NBC_01756]WSC90075.1 hypothetical protein OIE48_18410 [Streptosporangium sp. NBC_01756]
MAQHPTAGDTADATPPDRWSDGPVLDVEAALDHVVTMANQLQANHRDSG